MKTKAEQRIEIAKDVLKHIKANKIIAKTRTYFKPKVRGKHAGKQLKEILPKIRECKVCALGSIFYSYINRYNNFVIPELGISEVEDMDIEMRELMSMFPESQLHLIETAFESKKFCSRGDMKIYSYETIDKAIDYRYRNNIGWIYGDEKALIHIMKNIIKNGGNFKP